MFFIFKKNTIIIALILIITFIVVILMTALPGAKNTFLSNVNKTVIIDAGHGGFDGGAETNSGIYEKDLNLSIAKELELELLKNGFSVIMTRNDDRALASTKKADIRARVKIMKENPHAIYIGIHCNKFPESKYKGLQVFYSKNNSNSKELANEIQLSIRTNLQPDNKREAKQIDRSNYILNNAPICAVIVECGFISNSEDLTNLQSDDYRKKLAEHITGGIINFYKKIAGESNG